MAGLPKFTTDAKKKHQKYLTQNDNPIEIIKDFGVGVVKSAQNDLLGGVGQSVAEQIFGVGKSNFPKVEGSLEKAQNPVSSSSEKSDEVYFGEKQSFHPNHLEQNTTTIRDVEVNRKIQQILNELRLLSKSVEKVSKEAAKISVEQAPSKGGIYHANFFEWILKTIKMARAKVDESNLWLQQFQSRSKQKGYWAMFKKHGTSFAMSDERSLASSVG